MPVSVHARTAARVPGRRRPRWRARTATSPLVGELDGVAEQVDAAPGAAASGRPTQRHRARPASAARRRSAPGPCSAARAATAVARILDARRAARTASISSSSLPASILEKSSMSLMMASSCVAGLADGLRRSRAAPRPAACRASSVRHADDAVERRADLVAHGGQERGLGARRRQGLLARGGEFRRAALHARFQRLVGLLQRLRVGLRPARGTRQLLGAVVQHLRQAVHFVRCACRCRSRALRRAPAARRRWTGDAACGLCPGR